MMDAKPDVIRYVVPRDVLRRIYWRRLMKRPSRIVLMFLLVVLGMNVLTRVPDDPWRIFGFMCILLCLFGPTALWIQLGRAIDANPHLTDEKSLEFNERRVIASGADWRNELAWTRFKGLSEDAAYFYLELPTPGLATVIPKRAMNDSQQAAFRRAAAAIGRAAGA